MTTVNYFPTLAAALAAHASENNPRAVVASGLLAGTIRLGNILCRDCLDAIDERQARDYNYRCSSCVRQEMRAQAYDASAEQMEQDWPE